MARKTKEEAQRTRQLLIESAIQQFALRGVTNTTLTDIADAAGVTRGAVYWHFASKTELFNEMWQQQPPLRDLIQPSQAIEYVYCRPALYCCESSTARSDANSLSAL